MAINDRFGLGYPSKSLLGFDIIESPNISRYVLPEEIIPGVPWPKGFRDEINTWSRSFLGTTNAIPKGQAYIIDNRIAMMRSEDIVRIQSIF